MGTMANSEDPDEMTIRRHFIRVYSVCLNFNKINLQVKKIEYFWEFITCIPSIFTMDHSDLTVSNFMENFGVLS